MNEENKNGMSIFNGPLPTDAPQVEEQVEETQEQVEEVPEQVVEESVEDEKAPLEVDEQNTLESLDEVKVSGTATEEEIIVDATKPAEEVLDEEEIVKDVKEETEKSKRGLFFIFFILAIVVVFLYFLPQILKSTGVI